MKTKKDIPGFMGMPKHITAIMLMVCLLVTSIVPALPSVVNADEGSNAYHDGDVKAIQKILEHGDNASTLKVNKMDPSTWSFVAEWSADSPKRIKQLRFPAFTSLTGTMDLKDLGELTNLYVYYTGYYDTGITEIDVSGLTKLAEINCTGNSLSETGLKLEGTTALKTLKCGSNIFKTIDLSAAKTLETLEIGGASNEETFLEELDLRQNTNLKTLYNYSNEKLHTLKIAGLSKLEVVQTHDCNLTAIDVSGCDSLKSLFFTDNKVETLTLGAVSTITNLQGGNNKLTSIDTSKLANLDWLLIGSNQLTDIDLSNNPQITYLNVEKNKLTNLDLAGMTDLGTNYISGNPLTSFTSAEGNTVGIATEGNGDGSVSINKYSRASKDLTLLATPTKSDVFIGWEFTTPVALSIGSNKTQEINAIVNEDFTATATFIQSEDATPITSIKASPSSIDMVVGGKTTIDAIIAPANASNKEVKYSSNSSNATVDQKGMVTGSRKGTAIITIAAQDGSGVTTTASAVIRQLVEKISLSPENPEVVVGKTLKLTPKIAPTTANEQAVEYQTGDASIAEVDAEGNITGIKAGSTSITAIAKDGSGIKGTTTVTVRPKPSVEVSKVTLIPENCLTPETPQMIRNSTLKLTAKVDPTNATYKDLYFTSSNESVATVDNEGNVKSIASGSVTITATAKDGSGVTASITVTVNNRPVTGITISQDVTEILVGGSTDLTLTYAPYNATNRNAIFTSSDDKIATVNGAGTVTGVGAGTVTITAAAIDGSGVTATTQMTVKAVPVSSITLTPVDPMVNIGKTVQLTATVAPSNATNKTLEYSSSNNKIASVDASGRISGIAPGVVIITAAANDGSGIKTYTLVTVVATPVTSVKLSPAVSDLEIGQTVQLTAAIMPVEATTSASLEYRSHNENIATVSASGKVTAVSAGTATITATTKDGSGITAIATVNVKANTPTETQKVTVTAKAGLGGTITKTGTHEVGTDAKYTYKPNANYKVQFLYVDGSVVPSKANGGTYIFTNIANDHTIEVYFEKEERVLGEDATPKKTAPKSFKVTAKKKKAVLTWKKSKGVTKYQVAYKYKGKKKWAYKTISAKKKKIIIKKLKSKKRYQFKIRSYKTTKNKKVYSKWSKVKTIKIK